jgi:hypothetical protein
MRSVAVQRSSASRRPKGLDKIERLLTQIAQDESLPALAQELFAVQGREYAQLQVELKAIELKLEGLASRQC